MERGVGDVMISKLDCQTYTNEFESHWVPHSFGHVPDRSKYLRKLPIRTLVAEEMNYGLIFPRAKQCKTIHDKLTIAYLLLEQTK